MNFPLQLLGELIAVIPEKPNFAVLLPDWKRSLSGEVIAVGPNVRDTKKGDRVSFGAAVGMDSIFSGTEVRILKENDLDFVYEKKDWETTCTLCKWHYAAAGETLCSECLNSELHPIRKSCKCKPGNPCAWHG